MCWSWNAALSDWNVLGASIPGTAKKPGDSQRDVGRSAGFTPNRSPGLSDIFKFKVPPCRSCWVVTNDRVVPSETWPSKLVHAAWSMYGRVVVFGASRVVGSPCAGRTTVCSNRGLPRTSWPLPGSTGYMPRALHTYQALICPQSSLPHKPAGESLYRFLQISLTLSAVCDGAPA